MGGRPFTHESRRQRQLNARRGKLRRQMSKILNRKRQGREGNKNEDNFAIVFAAMGVSTKHQAHFCHVFRGIIFL